MRKLPIAAFLTLSFGAVACGKEPPTSTNQPVIPAGLETLFLLHWSEPFGTNNSYAGHAFLVSSGIQRLALTAYHVAGPVSAPGPGGVSAWLGSPFGGNTIRLGARVPVDDAATINALSSQHDIAAFEVLDWDAARAFQLATTMPAVGDIVYVLAVHQQDPFNPDPRGGPRRYPARVAVSHDSAFVYVYTASANSNGSSGAAVLDGAGKVVGINVGSIVSSANTWNNYRTRYGSCCDGLVGGEVGGMAVNVKSLRRHFGENAPQ